MDAKVVEQKQLVERYLFGRLSPPEAKFFEQIVRNSPELAERMGLPQALKRAMHLLDETGTEWREKGPARWQSPWVIGGLAALALLLLVLALAGYSGKNAWAAKYASLSQHVHEGILPPPARTSVFRLHPARPGEKASLYPIGTRASPTLAEIRLDLSYSKAALFKVVIRGDDGAYWGRIDNAVKDSNGDLRFALNSAAFAAGTYELEVVAVNLRGEGETVGAVRLRVDAG